MVQIVAQRIEQSGNQTRSQNIHGAAVRIGERHCFSGISSSHVGLRHEGLPLNLIQSQARQNSTRFRDLIVNAVVGIRANRSARLGCRNFVHAVQPADFLDQLDLEF